MQCKGFVEHRTGHNKFNLFIGTQYQGYLERALFLFFFPFLFFFLSLTCSSYFTCNMHVVVYLLTLIFVVFSVQFLYVSFFFSSSKNGTWPVHSFVRFTQYVFFIIIYSEQSSFSFICELSDNDDYDNIDNIMSCMYVCSYRIKAKGSQSTNLICMNS